MDIEILLLIVCLELIVFWHLLLEYLIDWR